MGFWSVCLSGRYDAYRCRVMNSSGASSWLFSGSINIELRCERMRCGRFVSAFLVRLLGHLGARFSVRVPTESLDGGDRVVLSQLASFPCSINQIVIT